MVELWLACGWTLGGNHSFPENGASFTQFRAHSTMPHSSSPVVILAKQSPRMLRPKSINWVLVRDPLQYQTGVVTPIRGSSRRAFPLNMSSFGPTVGANRERNNILASEIFNHRRHAASNYIQKLTFKKAASEIKLASYISCNSSFIRLAPNIVKEGGDLRLPEKAKDQLYMPRSISVNVSTCGSMCFIPSTTSTLLSFGLINESNNFVGATHADTINQQGMGNHDGMIIIVVVALLARNLVSLLAAILNQCFVTVAQVDRQTKIQKQVQSIKEKGEISAGLNDTEISRYHGNTSRNYLHARTEVDWAAKLEYFKRSSSSSLALVQLKQHLQPQNRKAQHQEITSSNGTPADIAASSSGKISKPINDDVINEDGITIINTHNAHVYRCSQKQSDAVVLAAPKLTDMVHGVGDVGTTSTPTAQQNVLVVSVDTRPLTARAPNCKLKDSQLKKSKGTKKRGLFGRMFGCSTLKSTDCVEDPVVAQTSRP